MKAQTVRTYWDEKLERNPLRTGYKDTDAGAFLSWMIEAAGDILREWTKEYTSPGYITEKINRIERNLIYPKDWTDPLSPGELQRLAKFQEDLAGLPTPDAVTQTVKNLLYAIADRNVGQVKQNLEHLKSVLHISQEKSPQTVDRKGKCYELAWRYLIKHDEGELVHGSVLSEGRRINHAWVDLPSGYTYEPVSEEYVKTDDFYKTYSVEVHRRYKPTQAAILAARNNNLGPWTEAEYLQPQTVISEEALAYDRQPIPFTPVGRLERGKLYVLEIDVPHPIHGYSKYHKEYSVVDLRGYRKGYEPRLDIRGVYTPNPKDIFRLGTGRLPPYQPTTTGDKLQAEMERLGVFKAWRIAPNISQLGNPGSKEPWQMTQAEYKADARLRIEPTLPPNVYWSEGTMGYAAGTHHKAFVKEAVAEGKPVPPEVLADYPDLRTREGNPDFSQEKSPQTVEDIWSFQKELEKLTPGWKVEVMEVPAPKFSIEQASISDKRKKIQINLWPGAGRKEAIVLLAHEYAHVKLGTMSFDAKADEGDIWRRGEEFAQQWGVLDEYVKFGKELAEYYERDVDFAFLAKPIRRWLATRPPRHQADVELPLEFSQKPGISQEKFHLQTLTPEIQALIDEVPDVDDPSEINYWKKLNGQSIYLEGWSDKCLAGTGFPPMEEGGLDRKIDYIRDLTPDILARKAKERGLKLLYGGFQETPDAAFLYGVTYGVYGSLEYPAATYQEEGERIAQQLGNGVIYNGPWMSGDKFIGYTFTDVAVTGTTFLGKDLEDCKANLIQKRKDFGAAPPNFIPKVIKRYPTEPITVEVGTAKVRGQFRPVEGQLEPEIIIDILERGTDEDLLKAKVELALTLQNRIQEVLQDEVPLRGEPVKGAYPPTVLTMDEYNKVWKPQGWNLIIIGPTSTWREEWGVWEAIRDIVQNCLDEAESYQWGHDELGLWISDKGKGLAVADFLLGPPKLKPDYARGKFGEGMKIAGLALVRKHYPVRIETVGRELWVLFIEQVTNGKAQSLAALWRPGGTAQGTIWHIIGYFGTSYPDRFAVNLPKFAIRAQVPAPVTEPVQRYNQLIVEDFPPEQQAEMPGWFTEGPISGPRIYARDIYLRKINSNFSYNLWGFPLAPDRHGPKDESQLWVDMGRLWCGVKDLKLLEVFFEMVKSPPVFETDESHLLSMSAYRMGQNPITGKSYAEMVVDNASVWRQAWENNFHDNAVIRTDERWDATVKHLGYYSISLQYDVVSTISRVIKTDIDLIQDSQERLREVQIIRDKDLSPTQLVHLELARNIADSTGGGPPIRGVHAAIIPPASDRVRTAGMYGRTTQEVFISSEQLDLARNTVDTTIHEVAHHTSGAEDGEEAHNRELTSLAGTVVLLTSQRSFDHIIEKPGFRW